MSVQRVLSTPAFLGTVKGEEEYARLLGNLFEDADKLASRTTLEDTANAITRADRGEDQGVQEVHAGNVGHPDGFTKSHITQVQKDLAAAREAAASLPPAPPAVQRPLANPEALEPVASTSYLSVLDDDAEMTYTSSGRRRKRVDYSETTVDDSNGHGNAVAGPSRLKATSSKGDRDEAWKGPKPTKKAKKSTSETGTPVSSDDENDYRRGYRSKTRSPDKRVPAEQTSAPRNETDSQIRAALKGKSVEVQVGRCLRPRYAKFALCCQCISKVVGDSCRFRDWRAFPIDPETGEIIGVAFFPDSTLLGPNEIPYPKLYGDPLSDPGLNYMKTVQLAVANALPPVLLRELKFWENPGDQRPTTRRVLRDVDLRTTCDFCALQVFAGSYSCLTCARDYCLDCFDLFPRDANGNALAPSPPSPKPKSRSKTPLSLDAQSSNGSLESSLPRLLRCGKGASHTLNDLAPVSRFTEDELRTHMKAMAEICLDRATLSTQASPETAAAIDSLMEQPTLQTVKTDRNMLQQMMEDLRGMVASNLDQYRTTSRPKCDPADPSGVEPLPHFVAAVDKVTPFLFETMRNSGDVIVMKGCDEKFKEDWSTEQFRTFFETDRVCDVVDAQTGVTYTTTIADFFGQFGKYEGRKGILKLKDFPPTNRFKKIFPDHYRDLMNSLPMPFATRRDGIGNIAAYTPKELNPPDIGPKIYAAFAGKEGPGGLGITRLHQDLADAVNIMVHSEKRPDGRVGCAAWDLFRSQDSNIIREFLTKKFGGKHKFEDPIHSQLFYLDSALRAELFRDYGVASIRIYQYTGQAVLIPAGCSHQVCNLADCIKVAIDFISPQNVKYCEALSREFRNENSTSAKPWKEDVLAYNQTMFNAWLTTLRLDKLLEKPYEWPLSSPDGVLYPAATADTSSSHSATKPSVPAKTKAEIVEMLMRDWLSEGGADEERVEVRMDKETMGRPEEILRAVAPEEK